MGRQASFVLPAIVLVSLLAFDACTAPAAAPTTAPPTATPIPATPTPVPTATPEPEPTQIPSVELSQDYLLSLDIGSDMDALSESLEVASAQWNRELTPESLYPSDDVTPGNAAVNRLLWLLSQADATDTAQGLVSVGAGASADSALNVYRVKLDELPNGEEEQELAATRPQGAVIRKGANLAVVGIHEAQALVCFSEDFDRTGMPDAPEELRKLYLAVLNIKPASGETASLKMLLGDSFDAMTGAIDCSTDSADCLWQVNTIGDQPQVWFEGEVGLAWMDRKDDGAWYGDPVVPNPPAELLAQFADHKLTYRLSQDGAAWEGSIARDLQRIVVIEAAYAHANSIADEAKSSWTWIDLFKDTCEKQGFDSADFPGFAFKLDADRRIIFVEQIEEDGQVREGQTIGFWDCDEENNSGRFRLAEGVARIDLGGLHKGLVSPEEMTLSHVVESHPDKRLIMLPDDDLVIEVVKPAAMSIAINGIKAGAVMRSSFEGGVSFGVDSTGDSYKLVIRDGNSIVIKMYIGAKSVDYIRRSGTVEIGEELMRFNGEKGDYYKYTASDGVEYNIQFTSTDADGEPLDFSFDNLATDEKGRLLIME